MSISSKNISLFYDEKQILKDISIEIKEGKITTLLGPNGAGKSSFLNIISGDLDFYNGDVFYNQRNLAEINIQEKAFLRSVMAQSQPIIFDFSVKEIVEMGWLEKGDIKRFKDSQQDLIIFQGMQALDHGGFEVMLEKLEDFNLLQRDWVLWFAQIDILLDLDFTPLLHN